MPETTTSPVADSVEWEKIGFAGEVRPRQAETVGDSGLTEDDLQKVVSGAYLGFKFYNGADVHLGSAAVPTEWDEEEIDLFLDAFKVRIKGDQNWDNFGGDEAKIAHVRMDPLEAAGFLQSPEGTIS